MTQAAFDRLRSKLDERSGSIHVEIIKGIDLAHREGDLEENGGCHVTRDGQARNETRILELQEILEHAEVGEATDDGTIPLGCVTEARVGKRKIRFLLDSRVANEGIDINVFSPDTPLGATLLKHREGNRVGYLAPTGKKIQVKILSVSVFKG